MVISNAILRCSLSNIGTYRDILKISKSDNQQKRNAAGVKNI